MGALIVVDDTPSVLAICSGGFLLDAEFSPQRLSELAKMDGAIILSADATRIARANVHLVPDPGVPTQETGTRHRTAERVGRGIKVPVLSISEDMSIITLFHGEQRHTIEPLGTLFDRGTQALRTLGRYRSRFDVVTGDLTRHEVDGTVTVRDVAFVLQRAEMMRRLRDEVIGTIVELGSEGRLVRLQLDELMAGIDRTANAILRDYLPMRQWGDAGQRLLAPLATDELFELRAVAKTLGLARGVAEPERAHLEPRGYRILSRVPRLAEAVVEQVSAHFGSLGKLLAASEADLVAIDGVRPARAKAIKEGLARVVDTLTAESRLR